MGALAGGLGGGGGASVSASSSASAGPLAGTTGNLVLNFGGINLGNQDIPLNAQSTGSANAVPTIGNTPASLARMGGVSGAVSNYFPLIAIAAVALFLFRKRL